MKVKIPIPVWGAIKIVGLYLLIGFLWILFSDSLVAFLVPDADLIKQISIYKGWGYVLVTGLLLYFLIKDHTDRLSEGEAWLRMAHEAADMGMWRYDVTSGQVMFDERASKQYGFDSLVVSMDDVLSRIHPDDAPQLEQEVSRALDPNTGGRYSTEYRVIHPDGSIRWLGVQAYISFRSDGGKRRPVLSVGTSRDISASKKADLQIHYFARLYAALSQVNQTIVRCNDRQELFESICKVAVDFGEFRLAWIGLLDEETGMLVPTAEYGFKDYKLPFHQIDPRQQPFRDGLVGLALRSGRVEICNDIQVETHMEHWREIAIRDHYHSAAAVPLRQNTRVVGLLNLYAEDADFFMVMEEQRLLEEMGMDISFALDTIEVQKQREQAVKELLESEERFQKAFYSGPVGLAITRGSDGIYIDANEAFSKIVGFHHDELIGQTSLGLNITTPVQQQAYTGLMMEQGFIHNEEMTLRSKTGQERVVLGSMELVELNHETCVLSTAIDITERKQAQGDLDKSEHRWTSLVRTIPDFIALFDEDGKYLFINHYAEGYSEKDVLGRQHVEYVIEESKPEYLRAFQNARQTGHTQYIEYQAYGDNGSTRFYDCYFTPIFENSHFMYMLAVARDITDRKAAEQALSFSQQQLRSMIHEAPISIAMFDMNMRYIAASHRWEHEYGNGLVELAGKSHYEIHPDIPERWRQVHRRGLAGETLSNDDDLWVHENGGKEWLSWAIVPWHDIQGKIGGIIISAENITARKLGEENLRESEERFRQLVNNIEEVFWIFDLIEKRDVYISPAVEKIWMLPAESFYEHPTQFMDSILSEDRPIVLGALAQQARGLKTDIQYRIARPDGSIRWVWDRAFPVFDEKDKLIRATGILADITETKKAEMDLLELNQNLEQRVNERTAEVQDLYQNAPAGYHSIDRNGIFVRINQTELDWLGYTREEVVGVKSFIDIITAESQKRFSESFPRFKAQGWIRDLEFEVVRKDGSTFPVLLNGTAIYDAYGDFVMSRSTLFDITERKEAELQIQAANVALEKAAKLKDEFLANMSHELRTPLNAIIGLSESLQENTYGELAPRQRKTLDVISESGRHLLELINDILDLSKIEAGMMELQYETIDLKSVCEAARLMVNEPARKKEIQITISIAEGLQTIQADHRRLKQMIVNLLSNAVKFTPQFGSIGLDVTPENDHAIRFTVWDTGIGIKDEHLKNLFKPFVQVDSSLTKKYEGTGLGLALVNQLAEKHNGSTGVESVPEQGSRFYFILPTQAPQSFASEEEPEPFELLPNLATPAASITLLLAEDNPTNMMFTSDYLAMKGFNIITAENGLQALEKAYQHKPNLIIMDIQMPELDGLEAIRRLRAAPEHATVPIIALTALAMPGDRERCLEAGASEYLAKPVSLHKLLGMINTLLQNAGFPFGNPS
ncbi:MAG: PAS domain S-box protein [Anaerolineales bacterium]